MAVSRVCVPPRGAEISGPNGAVSSEPIDSNKMKPPETMPRIAPANAQPLVAVAVLGLAPGTGGAVGAGGGGA